MNIRETALNAITRIFPELGRKTITHSKESKQSDLYKPDKLQTKSELQLMYQLCPEIFKAVNFHASQVSNFTIETKSKAEQEIINQFLKTLSKSGTIDSLRQIIYKTSVSADVFGIGPIELNSTEGSPFTVSLVHPNAIEPKRGLTGNIIFNGDKVDTWIEKSTEKEIPGESIAYLRYNEFADELYGTSLVQVCYSAGLSKLNIELGLAAAIYRVGFPTILFKVGNEKKEPTEPLMKQVQELTKDFGSVRQFTHENWIEPKIMESFSLPQTTEYTNNFIQSIATGAGLPVAFLTGRMKEMTYNSAPILMEFVTESVINPRRSIVTTFIKNEILDKLFELHGVKEPIAEVIYEPPFPRVKESVAKTMKIMADTRVDEKHVFTAEEIRALYY